MPTETDNPCECGNKELEIESGFVGYMGDRPCYEDYATCTKCGKQYNNQKINQFFNEPE